MADFVVNSDGVDAAPPVNPDSVPVVDLASALAETADPGVTPERSVALVCQRCSTFPGTCEGFLGASGPVDPSLRAESYQFYLNVTRNEICSTSGPLQDWADAAVAGSTKGESFVIVDEASDRAARFEHLDGDPGIVAIVTDMSIASLRDLRGRHADMLRQAIAKGTAKMEKTHDVKPEDVVAFVEYPPMCRPFHVLFRRAGPETEGAPPSAQYLVDDVLDKLESGPGDYFGGACLRANYSGVMGMSPELVAHSHVADAAHPFRGSPRSSDAARLKAASKKTRWIAPEAEPSTPLLQACEVRVVKPGIGGSGPPRVWQNAGIFLTSTTLQLRSTVQTKRRIAYPIESMFAASITDIVGAEPKTAVTVYFAHIKKPGVDFHRERDQVVLAFSSLSEAKTWEMALKWLAATGTVGEGPVPRRKLLVLLNPVGGLRKGRKIWAQIEPMFALSHVDATMVETTHANHAKEHVQGCTLDDLGNGIATISGDGLLNEVIQGLMERPDSAKARRIPLAVIPAGSGNGLAVSLMTPGPVSAVWNIIKGATRELDLSSVRQGSTQRWAFLSVAWGLTADIDMESEKYRWMGETRFTVAAIPRIFRLKSYPGKLTYRKSTREETIPTAETGLDGHGLRSFFDGADTADESQWVSVEGDFVHVLAIQTEWQSSEFKAGGFCVLNDGYIDLQWMMKGVGAGAVLKILLDEGSSEFVKKPFVHYVKTRAFKLEPSDAKTGVLTVDGELLEYSSTFVEVHPRALTLIVPRTSCIPTWSVDDLEGFSDARSMRRSQLPKSRFKKVSAV